MRLHNLCHRMHVDDQEFTLESVRLSDVDNAFPSLRYVNSQDKDSDKFIILDLSDDDALKSLYADVQEKIAELTSSLDIASPGSGCLTQSKLAGLIEKDTIRMARKIRDASLVKVLSCDDSGEQAPDSPIARPTYWAVSAAVSCNAS